MQAMNSEQPILYKLYILLVLCCLHVESGSSNIIFGCVIVEDRDIRTIDFHNMSLHLP